MCVCIYIYTFRIGQDKVEQVTLVPLCLFTFFGWEKLMRGRMSQAEWKIFVIPYQGED